MSDLRFVNPDVNDIEYQRYCFEIQKPDRFDGLMPFLYIDGAYYQKTGQRDGWGVYVPFGQYKSLIAALSQEGYFVHRDGRLIPLAEYVFTKRRDFVPYSY